MTLDHILDTLSAALRDAPGIRALFLGGSHATGTADAYSDVDFLLVAEDGANDATAALWRGAVEQLGEIVLWWDRTPVPTLINAITADWTRLDVVILRPDQLGHQSRIALRPVFDPGGIYDTLAEGSPHRPTDPNRLRWQIEEFLRVLGLLHLVLGRKEYLNGVQGVFHLRNLLVDLMIAETDAPHRGGALHLNRLIGAEHKDILYRLPPAVPERQALIDAHLAYAAAYLPRARSLAAQAGVDWPERFEEATWQRLERAAGLRRPY